jgi:hypothetical protein
MTPDKFTHIISETNSEIIYSDITKTEFENASHVSCSICGAKPSSFIFSLLTTTELTTGEYNLLRRGRVLKYELNFGQFEMLS